jgi:hypothetical protein
MLFFSSQNCRSFVKLACLRISLLEYQNSDVRIKVTAEVSKNYSKMPCNCDFSTVKAKGTAAGGAGGGGDMAALILNPDSIWKRSESHLVALCLAQNPLKARLGGQGIWNKRFTEKINLLPPFQDPTQNSSYVQHTAYWLNRLFRISLFRTPPIIFI